jgi:cytochrome c oxidase assembly protein subunit 15
VRATGSGAGCGNHWPLCNGEVIPHTPRIDTIIEFTHRMMSGGAVFLTLALLLAIFATSERLQPARKAIVVATVLLFNEAILGALLVKLGYVTGNRSVGRVVLLSIHLSNTCCC